MRALILSIIAAMSVVLANPAHAEVIDRWQQSPRLFLPGSISSGERTVAQGEAIFSEPLRWADSIRLPQDVIIAHNGRSVTLTTGLQLPQVLFTTKAKPALQRRAYCTRMGMARQKGIIPTDNWLFEEPFNAKAKQICLEDANGDGLLEASFVKTDQHIFGRPDIIHSDKVDPVPIKNLSLDQIDGSSDEVSLRVRKLGKDKVMVELFITVFGYQMMFNTISSGEHYTPKHRTLKANSQTNILGVIVETRGVSSQQNSAIVHLRPDRDNGFVVIPNFVSGY